MTAFGYSDPPPIPPRLNAVIVFIWRVLVVWMIRMDVVLQDDADVDEVQDAAAAAVMDLDGVEAVGSAVMEVSDG